MAARKRTPSVKNPDPLPEPVPIAPELPTPDERRESGKARRVKVPRSVHGSWQPSVDRRDPIALLEASSANRLRHLVPIRYGRMLQSPFTYLRGSPGVMANDLATTPTSGLQVQLCGDAHLLNFGLYASPERNLLFDINDFDETIPGPWEWDLKRLAASCVVAARTRSFPDQNCKEIARASATAYREKIREYSQMPLLHVWYSRVDSQEALRVFGRNSRKEIESQWQKARSRTSLDALAKLATVSAGRLQIVENPPLITHVPDEELCELLRRFFSGYKVSLQDDRRALLDRYRFVDFALKVVGVGSVGTRCYLLLLDASHAEDPLFLQIKEATTSVFEPFVASAHHRNQGHRVVAGQRLMQSASDLFLGWYAEGHRHYYVRQLRDMKASADLAAMSRDDFRGYAQLCGWVLARAHARSGDAAEIAGYLGKSDVFDEAIASFAMAYADQTNADYEQFQEAVRTGRLPAEVGI